MIMTQTITEMALALGRWVELSILGKATIMLLLGLVAVRLACRARASVRHLLLATTFATLLALPLLVFIVPGLTIEVPVARAAGSDAAESVAPSSDVLLPAASDIPARQTVESDRWSAPSWPTLLRWGWIAGALVLFASLAGDLWRLRRLRRNGLPWWKGRELMQSLASECGIRRKVEVLLHEGISGPL